MIALLATALGEPGAPQKVEVQATGYLDVGVFDVTGDGVSYDRDVGGNSPELQPDRGNPAWLFWGDPWAAAVNSQGEAGDLGLDRNTLDRADRIQSGGRPTALVNAYNQGIVVTHGYMMSRLNVWFEPRGGELGDLGDNLAVDVAWVRFTPWRTADVDISVGKIESVFGLEWWYRRAPERHGVTPSLISRYTTGTPVGASLVGTALRRRLQLGFSVTNGNTMTERFGHYRDEVDTNGLPTGTARLGWVARGSSVVLELGASGQVGPQDGQRELDVVGRQLGADVKLDVADKARFMAEIVDTLQPGRPGIDRLDAIGAYGELQIFVDPVFAPHIRVDWRNAQMRTGPNHYSTEVMRATAGARLRFGFHVLAKAEFIKVVELLGDEIDDDVVTSSLVFQY